MADISDHLGKAGINIETLEAFVVRDWDIVQLTVSDYDQALCACCAMRVTMPSRKMPWSST